MGGGLYNCGSSRHEIRTATTAGTYTDCVTTLGAPPRACQMHKSTPERSLDVSLGVSPREFYYTQLLRLERSLSLELDPLGRSVSTSFFVDVSAFFSSSLTPARKSMLERSRVARHSRSPLAAHAALVPLSLHLHPVHHCV